MLTKLIIRGGLRMKYCSQCGEPLSDDCLFCIKCGHKVGAPGPSADYNNVNSVNRDPQLSMQSVKETTSNVANQFVSGVNNAVNSQQAQGILGDPDKLIKIGYGGAILAAVSVFVPIIKVIGIGVSTMDTDPITAVVFLLIAGLAGYGFNSGKYSMALAAGQTYLVMAILFFIGYQSKMHEAAKDGFFGQMVGSAVSLGAGFYLFILASIVLIAVAGLIHKLKTNNVSGVVGSIVELEKEIIELKNVKMPAWVCSVVLIVVSMITIAFKK